jgi:Phosphotransferase enzyme family
MKDEQASQALLEIAEQFKSQGQILGIEEFGSGNINGTFRVTLAGSDDPHFILQRINTHVFQQPRFIMQNMRTFTDHVRDRLHQNPLLDRRWEVLRVLATQDGQDYWCAPDQSFWRAISFIEDAQAFDTIQSREHGNEIGYGLGMFHHLISDLPTEKLADTLEGFHITPNYLQHYEQVLANSTPTEFEEVQFGMQFIRDRRDWAHVLENAKTNGKLKLRPIHGDPKINNVMICNQTGKAVSLIDLDTVKPGLVHYDIGDCLRSSCNPMGEETHDFDAVEFETDLCRDVLQGYLSVAKHFLTEQDYDFLFDAIRLIAFELGLRFFTDFLAGDVYFKVNYPQHNLARALVQFKLTESIEMQETKIRTLINDLR